MYQEVLELSSTEWRTFGLDCPEGPIGLAKTVQLRTSTGSRRQDIYIAFTPNFRGGYSPALLLDYDCLFVEDKQVGWLALEFIADGETLKTIPVQLEQKSSRAMLGTLVSEDVNQAFQCFLSGRELRLSLHAPCGLVSDFPVPPDASLPESRSKVAAALDRADALRALGSYNLPPIPRFLSAERSVVSSCVRRSRPLNCGTALLPDEVITQTPSKPIRLEGVGFSWA